MSPPEDRELDATKASAVWPGVLAPSLMASIVAGAVFMLFRARRPRTPRL